MKHLLLFFLILNAVCGFGQIPRRERNTSVHDLAHVLPAATVSSFNDQIKQLEERTSVKLTVIVVDTIPEKYKIGEFAGRISRKWHLSRNGILYITSVRGHLQHIKVGPKPAVKLNNFRCIELLYKVKPFLWRQDHAGGIENLIQNLALTLSGDSIKVSADGKLSVSEASSNSSVATLSAKRKTAVIIGASITVAIGIFILLVAYAISQKRKQAMKSSWNFESTDGSFGADKDSGKKDNVPLKSDTNLKAKHSGNRSPDDDGLPYYTSVRED